MKTVDYSERIVTERFRALEIAPGSMSNVIGEEITAVPISLALRINADLISVQEKLKDADQTITTFRALTESLTKLATDLRAERDQLFTRELTVLGDGFEHTAKK
jgi:hypothetical protein